MKKVICLVLTLLAVAGIGGGRLWAAVIEVNPEVFDFGWVPDNAMVFCDFTVRNISGALIPLTSVQPSCGCTATDFTPEDLSAASEKKININFNTRGYTGISFNKSVNVSAGTPPDNLTVRVMGSVADAKSLILPDGDGIVSFEKGADSEKKISILNKSTSAVTLAVVQAPASWVHLNLRNEKIEPSKSVELEVKASGPFEESRQTSFTLEATHESQTHRVTIAIRTGESPQPYRRIRNAPKGPSSPSSPGASPSPGQK